jgi:hypothetical protein
MAKIPDIKIKFSATGAKGLNQAIKSLDRSTKSLINSQAKIVASNAKQTQSNKKLGDGLLHTNHSTRILGGSFAVLRSKMLLASFAGGIFSMTIGKMAKLAGEQERAENRLSTAIGKRSDALLAFASEQQKATRFGDEETITAMSLVGAYTDNEKAIARLTKASMDLAVAKGMDLNSAVDLVSKSVFSSTNALSRYGVEIVGTQGSTERLESATQALSDLYGGQAEKDADTYLGAMEQLGNSLGDVGERIGFIFIPAILASAKGIKEFADNLSTEELKSYGASIVAVTVMMKIWTATALSARAATVLLTKALKVGVIAAVVAALAEGVKYMGWFKDAEDEAKDSTDDLKGAMEELDAMIGTSAMQLQNEITLLQLKKELMNDGNLSLQDRMKLIEEEQKLLKTAGLSKEQQDKKSIELDIQKLSLEEKIKEAKLKTVSSSIGALGELNKSMKGSAKVSKRLAQAQAIIDTYAGANNALKTGVYPFNLLAMASVIATGLANVANIEAQQFAKGGDFVTNKPELIMVGEAGREHVQITPVDRPEERAMKASGITVNIQGGVVDQDYVTNTLIPAINSSGQALA